MEEEMQNWVVLRARHADSTPSSPKVGLRLIWTDADSAACCSWKSYPFARKRRVISLVTRAHRQLYTIINLSG